MLQTLCKQQRKSKVKHMRREAKSNIAQQNRKFIIAQAFSIFSVVPAPPPGLPGREAENTVKTSAKCTFISVSAREHPVGGNNQNIP